jgi:hypothetical protein
MLSLSEIRTETKHNNHCGALVLAAQYLVENVTPEYREAAVNLDARARHIAGLRDLAGFVSPSLRVLADELRVMVRNLGTLGLELDAEDFRKVV